MSNYPRLSKMGIKHPKQIKRYSVSSLNQIDYLLVSYDRPEGSLLPISRTYEFPRVAKQSSSTKEPLLFTTAEFTEAVDELKEIMESRTAKKVSAQAILQEIERLEEEVLLHLASLRELVNKSKL